MNLDDLNTELRDICDAMAEKRMTEYVNMLEAEEEERNLLEREKQYEMLSYEYDIEFYGYGGVS